MWIKTTLSVLAVLFIGAAGAFAQDIFTATRAGDIPTITRLAEQDPRVVNSINDSGFNPLMIACYRGLEPTARLLLEKGANVNASSPEGTALQAACYQDNTAIATLLLEYGADVNAAGSPDGNTALHFAVLNQNETLVARLVKAGADLKTRNKDSQTASSLAATLPNERIRELVKGE